MDTIEIIAALLDIVTHTIAAMIVCPAMAQSAPYTGAMRPVVSLRCSGDCRDNKYKYKYMSGHVCKVGEKVGKSESPEDGNYRYCEICPI